MCSNLCIVESEGIEASFHVVLNFIFSILYSSSNINLLNNLISFNQVNLFLAA